MNGARSRLHRFALKTSKPFERVYTVVDRYFSWRVLGPTLAIVCAVLATGYADDRRSCERQVPPRETIKQFIAYQTIFQGALATLDPAGGPRATIVDPDTGRELQLTRDELRRWVQHKQSSLLQRLPIQSCSSIPPGK